MQGRDKNNFSLIGLIFLVLFFLTGCGKFSLLGNQESPSGSIRCTMNFQYGLGISVKSKSNQSLEGAKLVVQDGDWKEEFEFNKTGSGLQYYFTDENIWTASSAGERPGNYIITLTHPNLIQPVQKNVKVTKSVCHVDFQAIAFEIE